MADERQAQTPEEEAAANLVCLAMGLRNAKKAEETTKRNRIALEEKLAVLVPTREVGQETKALANGMKLVIKRGLSYKADLSAIQEIFANQDDLDSVPIKIKTTRELDVKGYEWYRANYPDVFQVMSEHVTVTPRKPSVTVIDKE